MYSSYSNLYQQPVVYAGGLLPPGSDVAAFSHDDDNPPHDPVPVAPVSSSTAPAPSAYLGPTGLLDESPHPAAYELVSSDLNHPLQLNASHDSLQQQQLEGLHRAKSHQRRQSHPLVRQSMLPHQHQQQQQHSLDDSEHLQHPLHSNPLHSNPLQSTTLSNTSPFSFTFPLAPSRQPHDSDVSPVEAQYQMMRPQGMSIHRRIPTSSDVNLEPAQVPQTRKAVSPHRPQASITTATANLSLGNQDSRIDLHHPAPHSRHSRKRSSISVTRSPSLDLRSPASSAAVAAATYRSHRRKRSTRFKSIDQDSTVLSLYQQGKSYLEIAHAVGLSSEDEARQLCDALSKKEMEWTSDDVQCLWGLLEDAERAKWKFISSELSSSRTKRIPPSACKKKFRDMFGVPEASSLLGSSLCYVVHPDGWSCLDSKPVSQSALQSVFEEPLDALTP